MHRNDIEERGLYIPKSKKNLCIFLFFSPFYLTPHFLCNMHAYKQAVYKKRRDVRFVENVRD